MQHCKEKNVETKMKLLNYVFLFVGITLFRPALNGQGSKVFGIVDYLGTWQWTSQLDTFTLRIRKIDTNLIKGRNKSLSFQVVGVHRFVRGRKLIESNFDLYPDTISAQVSMYGRIYDSNKRQLHIFVHGLEDNVFFEGDLFPFYVDNKF